MLNKFRSWLPLAVAITVVCGLGYVLAQQSLRMAANDPQVEISEELSNAVINVDDPSQFDAPQKLEIAKSLSAFWVVYDENGKALASNGQLDGKAPVIPKSSLEASKAKGESRITWQPSASVRQAVVIRPYSGKTKGYVAAGRSLREVEKRDKNLMILTLLGWVVAMAGSLIASLFMPKFATHHAIAHEAHHEHHHEA